MKLNYCVLIFTAVILCNVSFAQEKTYTESETNVTASNGEQFSISLESNKSTGYSWSSEVSDPTMLSIEGPEYVTPEVKVLGKGGKDVWKLTGLMPGTATVTFKYSRSWEAENPPAKTVIFNVVIE